MNNLEIEKKIDDLCLMLDDAINEQDKKKLEIEIFETLKQLEENTIYLRIQ